jgi:cob(I)alamin adenosyltransferase
MNKGLLIVYTGNGKGKTTAALGLALRAMGHDLRVCVIQFIKSNNDTGESLFSEEIKRLNKLFDFYVLGAGFTWSSAKLKNHVQAARDAWEISKELILSEKYDLIILDELTYIIRYKMVNEDEVINFLSKKPENLHLVITGRYASELLINAADLVTEMTEIKHPFKNGIRAQQGIDF